MSGPFRAVVMARDIGENDTWRLFHSEGWKTRLRSDRVREDFYQSVWHRRGRQIYINTKLWKYWQVNFAPLKGTKLQWPRAYCHKTRRRFAGASVWCSVAICLTRFIRKIDLPQMPEKREGDKEGERGWEREREWEGDRCLRLESAQIRFIDTSSLRWLLLLICAEESATDPVFSLTAVNNFIWFVPLYSQLDESFTGQSRPSSRLNASGIKTRGKIKGEGSEWLL